MREKPYILTGTMVNVQNLGFWVITHAGPAEDHYDLVSAADWRGTLLSIDSSCFDFMSPVRFYAFNFVGGIENLYTAGDVVQVGRSYLRYTIVRPFIKQLSRDDQPKLCYLFEHDGAYGWDYHHTCTRVSRVAPYERLTDFGGFLTGG